MNNMGAVIAALRELEQDNSVPKNIKAKIAVTIQSLEKDTSETSIRVSKALQELEEIADTAEMQPYTRTQLFNIVSLLEVI